LAAGGSAYAQVYSLNIVGYVNRTVPGGKYVLLSNPLTTGGNTVAEVVQVAGDMTIYTYGAGGFQPSTALGGSWIEGDTIAVAPGTGFFAQSGSGNVTVTFVGEVAVGKSVTIPHGISLVGSALPQGGTLDALEYPVGDETVLQYDSTKGYSGSLALGGSWIDPVPTLAVGDGFFVINDGASKTWTRSFKIN
jgi:hypothetical protein